MDGFETLSMPVGGRLREVKRRREFRPKLRCMPQYIRFFNEIVAFDFGERDPGMKAMLRLATVVRDDRP